MTEEQLEENDMNEPVDYATWSKKRGELSWYECPVIVEEKVENNRKIMQSVAELISKALASELFKQGAGLNKPDIENCFDWAHHSKVINASIKSKYECLPEQYVEMAYDTWLKACGEVKRWENMSLGSYIKYWIRRHLGKRIKEKK